MNTTTRRPMTKASVQSIMGKRILIPKTAVGQRVKFLIAGDGNTIDVTNKEGETVQSVVEPGTVLQKTIFNLQANSGLAMANERNRQYVKDALLAEKAGDAEKASELYNKYLNACQMSFGVLLPSTLVGKLSRNVEIVATVQEITTEAGSLLTIDPATISIAEPKSYGTTTFDLDSFLEPEEKDEEKKDVPADVDA